MLAALAGEWYLALLNCITIEMLRQIREVFTAALKSEQESTD